MTSKILIIILFIPIFCSCKKPENNLNQEIYNPDIKKFELLNDDLYILTESGLFFLKENSNKSEKIKYEDNLFPLDIIVFNEKLYILGISQYKLKLVVKDSNKWTQILLPEYINSGFIDETVKKYKEEQKNNPTFNEKYDSYDVIEPDSYHKEYILHKILSDYFFLSKDKSLILINADSIYYYVNEKWISNKISVKNSSERGAGPGEIIKVKDSVLYYGMNMGEWGGYFECLDFKKEKHEWKDLLYYVNISGVIFDTLTPNFYYSTNLAHMGGIDGSLYYYNNGKIKLLYDFAGKDYKKEFAKERGTVITDIQKIVEKIFVLTEHGIFLYEKNKVIKLIDDFEKFEKFYIDKLENIYVNSKNGGFLKYKKEGNEYKMSKISFYKFY